MGTDRTPASQLLSCLRRTFMPFLCSDDCLPMRSATTKTGNACAQDGVTEVLKQKKTIKTEV